MKLVFLPVNVCWCFLFGDTPIRMADENLLFKTRALAIEGAKRRGLVVSKAGSVSIPSEGGVR